MSQLSIKQLVLYLVTFTIFVAIVFLSANYFYVKRTVEKSLELESINKAYYVAKRLTEMNDKIARDYAKHEEDMYASLKIAQEYFKNNGPQASLHDLKKKLEKDKKGVSYNVFLINSNYIVENTTFEPDMNLDFRIVPDALGFIKKAFEFPNHIDLSPIKDDVLGNDYKRYILQHSISGDYLVQLSLSLGVSSGIKDYTHSLHKEIPTLLNTEMYSVYDETNIHENVYLIWSGKYSNMTKNERLLERNVFDIFMNKFDPQNSINKEEYKKEVFKFASTHGYKDRYFSRNGKYIHEVVMPFYSYINGDEGTVHILVLEFDETDAKEIIYNMNVIHGVVWITLVLGVFLIITLINKRIIFPITMLQSKMKNKSFVENDILVKNNDEVSSMMRIYNRLLRDLNTEISSNEELLEQFKTFTGNAIHQVRTPVNVIKIALEMLETKDKDALLQIQASLISIEHMYDSLTYSLQEGDIKCPPEKLDFSQLLQERIALFSTVALAHDTKIDSYVEFGVFVNINPIEAEYLIDNNISNAIKYGKVGKNIGINLSSVAKEVMFSISSAGKAIEDTSVIFQRYHRDDSSRGGSGIGLHMVKNICQKNDILINVEYTEGYNKFNYYLPKI